MRANRHVARHGRAPDYLVLIIDRHPLFLQALAGVVGAIPQVRVTVRVLRNDLDAVPGMQPDLVILDPFIEGSFSTRCLETAKRLWPTSSLMVVTDCTETEAVASAMACGARGFVLKSEPVETVRAAIELLCRGAAAFSLSAAGVMAARFAPPPVRPSLPPPGARSLSAREVEILKLVACGYTDSEIAGSMHISPRTAEHHITNILNKLNCRNRSQAVAQMIGSIPPFGDGEALISA